MDGVLCKARVSIGSLRPGEIGYLDAKLYEGALANGYVEDISDLSSRMAEPVIPDFPSREPMALLDPHAFTAVSDEERQ